MRFLNSTLFLKPIVILMSILSMGCSHKHHSILTTENREGRNYEVSQTPPGITLTLPGEPTSWELLEKKGGFYTFQNKRGHKLIYSVAPLNYWEFYNDDFKDNQEILFYHYKWEGDHLLNEEGTWASEYRIIEKEVNNDESDYLIWEVIGKEKYRIILTGVLDKSSFVFLSDTRPNDKDEIIKSLKWSFEKMTRKD